MKNAVLFISVLAIVAGCFGCQSPEPKAENQKRNARLLELAQKEPKVVEAIVTDGTNRSGYAGYFCNLIDSTKSDVRWVKVVEAGSAGSAQADNAYGVLLGESHCDWLK